MLSEAGLSYTIAYDPIRLVPLPALGLQELLRLYRKPPCPVHPPAPQTASRWPRRLVRRRSSGQGPPSSSGPAPCLPPPFLPRPPAAWGPPLAGSVPTLLGLRASAGRSHTQGSRTQAGSAGP